MKTLEEEKNTVDKKAKKQKPPINSKEYVEELIEKSHRNIKIAVIAVSVIVILLIISTIFAIATMTSSKIITGITIDSVNVSGLDKTGACKILEEKLKQRQQGEIKLKYNDYEQSISLEELEITANIEETVDNALKEGRNNNIFANNFNIIKRKFQKQNIDLQISYNDEVLERKLIEINANMPGLAQDYLYSIEEDQLIITKGKDGVIIDKDNIKNQIKNMITDLSSNVIGEYQIPVKEQKCKEIDLEEIYNQIHTEPQDAYIIEEPFQVIKDIDGVDLAITMEEAKALLNEDKEEYSIPLKITKANKTVADIGSKAFPDRLGTCTTRYDAGNINRSTNLGIATRKINEYVLQPGEVFSYNRALGPRTVQNGYKEAHVFSGGEVVDGLGGGICQISSTLYNAVLEANLEIVERHNHSFTSGYLPAGKDATVVYGAIDFRFRNSRKYPIKITASISGGVATVSIWGLKEEVEYDVKIVSTILQNYPCAEEVIYDPNLRDGMRQIVKAGTDGCKSVTYKYVYSKSGQLISKTHLSTDTYGTIKRVVRVGTGGIPQEPTPTPSTTPEPSPSMDPTPSVSPSPEPSVEPSPTPSTSPAPEPSTTPDPSPSPEPSEEPDGE